MSAAVGASLDTQIVAVQQNVTTLTITCVDEYCAAAEISKSITALRKEVEAAFNPIIEKAHQAHKQAIEQKKKYLSPLEQHQRVVDQKLLAWNREQERIRREQEEKLRQEERKRQEEQALREAEELHRQGELLAAEAVIEQAVIAPAPVVALPKTVPKVEGFSSRAVWRWRVVNESLIPRQYLKIDEIKVSGVVRALKDKSTIPGIEVFSEDSAIHR